MQISFKNIMELTQKAINQYSSTISDNNRVSGVGIHHLTKAKYPKLTELGLGNYK